MGRRQCADCRYFDIDHVTGEGIAECEKLQEQVFANDIKADVCRDFSSARYDTYKRERAKTDAQEYREKNKGYTSTGCYITTAIVTILGIEDDCPMLMTLRRLRKDYMQNDPQYKDVLMKYDTLGPAISMALYHDENRQRVAQDILIYLSKCQRLIEREQFDEAIRLYTEMTEALIRKYITSYTIGDEAKKNYDQTAGGHGAFTMKRI